MACPAGVKSHHTWKKDFSILLDNSFIELSVSNQTFGKTKKAFHFIGQAKQGEKNMLHNT